MLAASVDDEQVRGLYEAVDASPNLGLTGMFTGRD